MDLDKLVFIIGETQTSNLIYHYKVKELEKQIHDSQEQINSYKI